MQQADKHKLIMEAEAVLNANHRHQFTMPASHLYPHQWLWDSCFIAIGLRHLNIDRSKQELLSLLRGQWRNGMLPNIIFNDVVKRTWLQRRHEGRLNPHAPNGISTSGLTQPPMLAEAVVRVGQKLDEAKRRDWYELMLPPLIKYHQWIYRERDPGHSGLVSLIHPYEAGLDNAPHLIDQLHDFAWPWWLRPLQTLKLDNLALLFRRDTRYLPLAQRTGNAEDIACFALMVHLWRQRFDGSRILAKPHFAIADLGFNCILIRANRLLRDIAQAVDHKLPTELNDAMAKAGPALEQLWDEASGQYFSRSAVSGQPIKQPTIAGLLPLYSGAISKSRAKQLVAQLRDRQLFGAAFPVPSVPLDSSYFKAVDYWQGPTWLNTNWLIIDGLARYGFKEEAKELKTRSLELVNQSGFSEYFSPLDGQPAGAPNFSWTAALTIDFLTS